MKKLNICIIANARAVHTCRWATALASRGHQVSLISIHDNKIPNVRVVSTRVGPTNSSGWMWKLFSYASLALQLRRTLQKIKPDVVNAHYCTTHGFIAAINGIRPLVTNLWGSDVAPTKSSQKIPWPRRQLARFALHRSDCIVSTSHYMRHIVEANFQNLPPIRVIPFGVDTTKFSPKPTTNQARSEEVIRIGFAKSLEKKYAPDLFLRGAAAVAKHCRDCQFVVAGDGSIRPECERLARELKIHDRTQFVGHVPHCEMPRFLRSLDILVNCSHQESFGVIICEASATGIPVVSTETGGTVETVINGSTGVLVSTNNQDQLSEAILKLAQNPSLRSRLGHAGRKLVQERFEWTDCVHEMENTYTATINRVSTRTVSRKAS